MSQPTARQVAVPSQPEPTVHGDEPTANAELEVSAIHAHKFSPAGCTYLVEWTSDSTKTWERALNLTDCNLLLAAYWREFVLKAADSTRYLRPSTAEPAAPAKKPPPNAKRARVAASPDKDLAEDRISVAKRVQARKALTSARTNDAALGGKGQGPSSAAVVASGTVLPSPPQRKKPVQRARKSTGRNRVSHAMLMLSGEIPKKDHLE